jgi:hypothetical protein
MSELTRRAKAPANGASGPAAADADVQLPAAHRTGEPSDLGPLAEAADDAVVRRTKDGWRVGDADVPDLTSAMVLADLISAELAAPEAAVQPAAATATTTSAGVGKGTVTGATETGTGSGTGAQSPTEAATQNETTQTGAKRQGRDASGDGDASGKGKAKGKSRSKDPGPSDTSKLRTTIGQLEHALTARIRVEQAIGVLAERHRIQPRQAFEQLRSAARNRGRRVIDIASDVVASATNPLLQLPDELSRPRSGTRQPRRNRQTPTILGSELVRID